MDLNTVIVRVSHSGRTHKLATAIKISSTRNCDRRTGIINRVLDLRKSTAKGSRKVFGLAWKTAVPETAPGWNNFSSREIQITILTEIGMTAFREFRPETNGLPVTRLTILAIATDLTQASGIVKRD
jgi:hypothetical protein